MVDIGLFREPKASKRKEGALYTAGPGSGTTYKLPPGGDLAGRGRLWPVGVETADGQLTLGLEDAALATSGRDRRCWRRNGREVHHLINPMTGAAAEGGLLRVTVVAPTAVEAEVLAKAIFLGAPAESPAVLVTSNGRTLLAGGLQ